MSRHAERIRKFWKPDGSTVDPANEAVLKQWMSAHCLSSAPGAIAMLMHSHVHRSVRAAVLTALDLLQGKGEPKGGAK